MKTTLMLSTFAFVGMLALPLASSAATFQYVDIHGNVKTEIATNVVSALTIATDISIHSGVFFVTLEAIPSSMYVSL
jgi:hypothetical protein